MLEVDFLNYIKENQLFNRGDKLLLAVSGGVDSVVLTALCHSAEFTFALAHVNFKLRGAESDADEIFVRKLADSYQAPLHVTSVNTHDYAEQNKVSVQVAARELRYTWFNELLKENGYQWLLTAHHADDNIETVLMHFFRGTGISGMRGMLPVTGKLVRPLLNLTKAEILKFAEYHKLEWRDDSSNASDKYSRNYFRNIIIPQVAKIFPAAEKNILDNIRRFADIEMLYRQSIEAHKKQLLEFTQHEARIPVLKLQKSAPLHTIVFEIIREYGFTAHQVTEIIHLLTADSGKMVQSLTHRIIRNRKWLIIAPRKTGIAEHIVITENDTEVAFADGILNLTYKKRAGLNVTVPKEEAMLNSSRVTFPLMMRKWRKGDYFYPLGLGKKKKISRFLIDNKLTTLQKEKVWVLETGNRICWVVGMRIDERFKVEENTAELLHIRMQGIDERQTINKMPKT